MKQTFLTIIMSLVLLCAFAAVLRAQNEPKQPSMEELAANEAERLERLLDLEGWQVFYVDSTLQHDYLALDAEMKSLQGAKVGNVDLYVTVQDKWYQQIYDTYQKIFTEEQWAKYLKSGAARQQKARDKRREKAAKNAAKPKN